MMPYERALATLNSLPDCSLNLIDVGCYVGQFTLDFCARSTKPVWKIGIDPCKLDHVTKLDCFIEAAIKNNCLPETKFYEYIDGTCNSLLPMTRNLTHDPAERPRKWFADHEIEIVVNTRRVNTYTLSHIIDYLGLLGPLHFLKIDAQGCDLDVFQSLGDYIPQCMFVQMETVTSHSRDITLYEGQSIFEDERPIMESLGFRVFDIHDYGAEGSSQEADVVYANNKLVPQCD